jgi:hypothetical protein
VFVVGRRTRKILGIYFNAGQLQSMMLLLLPTEGSTVELTSSTFMMARTYTSISHGLDICSNIYGAILPGQSFRDTCTHGVC